MTPIVIYHANCRDGMCSAMIAHQFLDNPELIAAQYGDPVPTLPKDADVYIVDFSYRAEELTTLCAHAHHVTVLDHHQSAIDRIGDLELENLEMVLDNSRSGAQITWDYFNDPDEVDDPIEEMREVLTQRPDIVEYVADRDLWKWEYEGTKAVNEYLAVGYPTIDDWVKDCDRLLDDAYVNSLAQIGQVLVLQMGQQVERLAKHTQVADILGGDFEVVLCNSPIHQSELGNYLADKHNLPAVIWCDNGEQHVFSVRSMDKIPQDARSIAESFGGGGHRNAAGFALSYENSII